MNATTSTKIINNTYEYVITNPTTSSVFSDDQTKIAVLILAATIAVLIIVIIVLVSKISKYKSKYQELSKISTQTSGWEQEALFWRAHFNKSAHNSAIKITVGRNS